MATITLKFDSRNSIAKKTLDYIVSLGVFEIEKTNPVTLKAIKEMQNGKTVKCKDFNDYLKKVK